MAREHDNIDDIFDDFEKDRIPIWDIIEMFQNGRDVQELAIILKERPQITSNILYIMSELTPSRVIPVWQSAASFAGSENFDNVYYALDIIHGLLSNLDKDDVLSLLNKVRVHEDSIDEKIRAITAELKR